MKRLWCAWRAMLALPRSEAAAEPFFDAGPEGATHHEDGAVLQPHFEIAMAVGDQLVNAIEAHDGRAMDADEVLRIEARAEPRDGVAHEILAAAAVQRDVVVGGADPIDVGEVDDTDAVFGTNRDSR